MIKIYSSYSKDYIYDRDGNLAREMDGGPALFISNYFKDNNCPVELIVKEKFKVDITLSDEGETGKFRNKPESTSIELRNEEMIILSPIANEWLLPHHIPEDSKVFVDVQGYVRVEPVHSDFWQHSYWKHIYCLKGTKEEILMMPEAVIENQKQRCLIATDGGRGIRVFLKNVEYNFAPELINPPNTIGAGDTFMAAVVYNWNEMNISSVINKAMADVSHFLKNK